MTRGDVSQPVGAAFALRKGPVKLASGWETVGRVLRQAASYDGRQVGGHIRADLE
jgi:hypothetical protein